MTPPPGLVLGMLESTPAKAQWDIPVGHLTAHKLLSCARIKRWWMAPSWPSRPADVPIETQFLLVEVVPGGPYAVLLPLIEGSFRSTLYGAAGRAAIHNSPKPAAVGEDRWGRGPFVNGRV